MPTGLKLPLGASKSGGIALVDGDLNNSKTITNALSDCGNENAFEQDKGIGLEMIFSNSENGIRANTVMRLKKIFKDFERQKRFKLLPATIEWQDGEDQTTILVFRYLDLESDEEKLFTFPLGG